MTEILYAVINQINLEHIFLSELFLDITASILSNSQIFKIPFPSLITKTGKQYLCTLFDLQASTLHPWGKSSVSGYLYFDSGGVVVHSTLTIALHFCPSARQFIHIAALDPGV